MEFLILVDILRFLLAAGAVLAPILLLVIHIFKVRFLKKQRPPPASWAFLAKWAAAGIAVSLLMPMIPKGTPAESGLQYKNTLQTGLIGGVNTD